MGHLRYIYKLEIIGGLALIKKDVEADYMMGETDKYVFKESLGDNVSTSSDKILGFYPIHNTIVSSIEDNPDYVGANNRDLPVRHHNGDSFYGPF